MTREEALRKRLLEKRRSLPEERAAELSRQICQRAEAFLQENFFRESFYQENFLGENRAEKTENFLLYYPLGREVSLLLLYEKLTAAGKRCYFPVTKKEGIAFFMPKDMEDFQEGNFHVMEPRSRDNPFAGGEAVVFVPGSVFDRSGNRMGYGKGYYDRFLAGRKDLYKIGICYDFQWQDKISCQKWDVPMDAIISEKGIKRI